MRSLSLGRGSVPDELLNVMAVSVGSSTSRTNLLKVTDTITASSVLGRLRKLDLVRVLDLSGIPAFISKLKSLTITSPKFDDDVRHAKIKKKKKNPIQKFVFALNCSRTHKRLLFFPECKIVVPKRDDVNATRLEWLPAIDEQVL